MTEKTPKTFSKRNLPQNLKISVKASLAKKAEDVVVLALSDLTAFTEYFLIMHGNSSRQIQALCEGIQAELRKAQVRPLSVEGVANAEWVLMDYGDFIVHIFTKEKRNYYSLEKLWGDAPKVRY